MDEAKQAYGCIGIFSIIIYIIIIIVGGSFRAEIKFNPANEKAAGEFTQIEDTYTSSHWLAGLIKGEQPDLQKILSKYMREGEQVSEPTITTKHNWKDCLISGVTFFIYTPMTVEIQGKVIKRSV